MRLARPLLLALLLAGVPRQKLRPETCRCSEPDLDFAPDGVRCRRCGCPPPEPGARGAA